MAKAMSITVAAADAMLTAFGTLCNSGIVRIYNGTMPTNVQTALSSNTVLAEATMANPAFSGFTTNGNNRTYAAAGTPFGDASANASGNASFFRVFTSGDVAVWQGTVGTADSDMIMAAVDIAATGPVNITSMSVSLPMA